MQRAEKGAHDVIVGRAGRRPCKTNGPAGKLPVIFAIFFFAPVREFLYFARQCDILQDWLSTEGLGSCESDELVKNRQSSTHVMPTKGGIQDDRVVAKPLDPGSRVFVTL